METKVVFRTGGIERKVAKDGFIMPATYIVCNHEFNVKTVDELFSKFTPVKCSEKLRKAAEEFLSGKRDSLTYNFGYGNSTFYAI